MHQRKPLGLNLIAFFLASASLFSPLVTACPPLPPAVQAQPFCKPAASFHHLETQAKEATQPVVHIQDLKIHSELAQKVVASIEKNGASAFQKDIQSKTGVYLDLQSLIPTVADQLERPLTSSPYFSILQCHYYEDLVRQKLRHFLPLAPGEDFELWEPETPPGSGANVYLVRSKPGGRVISALKIDRTQRDKDHNHDALFEVLTNLAGEAFLLHPRAKGLSAASNLALGQLAKDPDEYFLLESAAQGRDLDHWMGPKRSEEDQKAALRSSAALFAALHASRSPFGAASSSTSTQSNGNVNQAWDEFKGGVDYDLKQAERRLVFKGQDAKDPKKDPVAFAVHEKRLTEEQGVKLRERIADSIAAYRTLVFAEPPRGPPKGIHGSYTHGDAHGGNIFIHLEGAKEGAKEGGQHAQNQVRSEFIDYGTLVWSIGKGAGVGDPANDVGRMVGHLEVEALKAGVKAKDASQKAIVFLKDYKEVAGIQKGSEEEKNFDTAVDFYRTRYFGIQSNDREGVKFSSQRVSPKDLTRGLYEVWMRRLD